MMWHITKKCHLASIMSVGLLIDQRMGLTVGGRCNWAARRCGFVPIFLTTDVNRLVREQLTPGFIARNELQVIKVDCSQTTVIDERKLYAHGMPIDFTQPAWTFVSLESFEPSKLKHVDQLVTT